MLLLFLFFVNVDCFKFLKPRVDHANSLSCHKYNLWFCWIKFFNSSFILSKVNTWDHICIFSKFPKKRFFIICQLVTFLTITFLFLIKNNLSLCFFRFWCFCILFKCGVLFGFVSLILSIFYFSITHCIFHDGNHCK